MLIVEDRKRLNGLGRPEVATAIAAGLFLLIVAAGCSVGDESATVTPSPATPSPVPTASPSPTPFGPTVKFTNGSGELVVLAVEVADEPEERSVGLMGRESLEENAGMIFTWPEDAQSGFYMRNTTIPLSIAFIGRDGVIIDIQDMQPLDETLHYAPAPYAYAVEVNQGWYRRNGIGVGDSIELALVAGSYPADVPAMGEQAGQRSAV
jgi:uncharacterized membrane protein (UPF0127 family)